MLVQLLVALSAAAAALETTTLGPQDKSRQMRQQVVSAPSFALIHMDLSTGKDIGQ